MDRKAEQLNESELRRRAWDFQGIGITREAWRSLVSRGSDLGLPNLQIETVQEFRDRMSVLEDRPEERATIIEQALLLFEHFYAHRLYKEDLYKAQPMQLLRELQPIAATLKAVDFHSRMLTIFGTVKDAHTGYILPPPFDTMTALLPFQLRKIRGRNGKADYLVTKVLESAPGEGFGGTSFGVGSRILRWDGLDIEDAIRNANEVGGNSASALSRGAVRATLRPLGFSRIPRVDEEIVTLDYHPPGLETVDTIRVRWGILSGFSPSEETGTNLSPQALLQRAFSMNHLQCTLRYAQQVLWNPEVISAYPRYVYGGVNQQPQSVGQAPVENPGGEKAPSSGESKDPNVFSLLPKQFKFQHTRGTTEGNEKFLHPGDLTDRTKPEKRFSYVRIFQFSEAGLEPGSTDDSAVEFRRILELLNEVAPDGLILDLRANGGGDIRTAERELQMLLPELLKPAGFHMANTPMAQAMVKSAGEGTVPAKFRDAGMQPEDNRITGHIRLTATDDEWERGQAYMGPVALLIDGSTYSAADIFSGGFADHNVGTIVGVDDATGGGGASVWDHQELVANGANLVDLKLEKLPMGVGMRLAALRSSRVNKEQLTFIEDVGVAADLVYLPTEDDALNGFKGLFRFVCEEVLSHQTRPRIDLKPVTPDEAAVTLVLNVKGAEKLTLRLLTESIHPTERSKPNPRVTTRELPVEVVAVEGGEITHRLEFEALTVDGLVLVAEALVSMDDGTTRTVARLRRQLRPLLRPRR